MEKSCSFGLPYVFFVLGLFVIFVISHFGFEGRTLVLIAPVPGNCLPFTFYSSWVKEPDNIAGHENCGVLRTTGVFSDRNCRYGTANYACKKPQSTCKYHRHGSTF